MDRREFLAAAAVAAAVSAVAEPRAPTEDALEELSLADIAARFDDGRLNSVELTQLYLDRIERLDRRGPTLSSVIEVNSQALAIAAGLDAERKSRGPRGPLHGVPILIKDNVETSDHLMSTAGSLALEGWYAPERVLATSPADVSRTFARRIDSIQRGSQGS